MLRRVAVNGLVSESNERKKNEQNEVEKKKLIFLRQWLPTLGLASLSVPAVSHMVLCICTRHCLFSPLFAYT